jgi:hypothetical protein
MMLMIEIILSIVLVLFVLNYSCPNDKYVNMFVSSTIFGVLLIRYNFYKMEAKLDRLTSMSSTNRSVPASI